MNNGSGKLFYVASDGQGSINMIVDPDNGAIVSDLSYDAWGKSRNPLTWNDYLPGTEPAHIFDRGYTGHEHLKQFGLINMNGRSYDPLMARMLSPDPFVQNAGNSQSYNRYSYAFNNPLAFSDPSGYLAFNVTGTNSVGSHDNSIAELNSNTKDIFRGMDAFWEYMKGNKAVGGGGINLKRLGIGSYTNKYGVLTLNLNLGYIRPSDFVSTSRRVSFAITLAKQQGAQLEVEWGSMGNSGFEKFISNEGITMETNLRSCSHNVQFFNKQPLKYFGGRDSYDESNLLNQLLNVSGPLSIVHYASKGNLPMLFRYTGWSLAGLSLINTYNTFILSDIDGYQSAGEWARIGLNGSATGLSIFGNGYLKGGAAIFTAVDAFGGWNGYYRQIDQMQININSGILYIPYNLLLCAATGSFFPTLGNYKNDKGFFYIIK